jgi:hypothetical protein
MSVNFITKDHPRCDDPGFTVKLFPHQLALAHAMLDMEQRREVEFELNGIQHRIRSNVGFLNDHLGSGKTLTCLCVIASSPRFESTRIYGVDFGIRSVEQPRIYAQIERHMDIREHIVQTTLIITAKHLKSTVWAEEVKKTGLRVGEGTEFHTYTEEDLNNLDVVLCSSDAFNEFIERHDYTWKRVIVDELDTMKFPNMREPATNFMWVVSNTIQQVRKSRIKSGLIFRFTSLSPLLLDKLSFISDKAFYGSSVDIKKFKIINADIVGLRLRDYLKGTLTERNEALLLNGDYPPILRSMYSAVHAGGNRRENLLLEVFEHLTAAIQGYDEGTKLREKSEQRLAALRANIATVTNSPFPCYHCGTALSRNPILLAPCHHTLCTLCATLSIRKNQCGVCGYRIDVSCCIRFENNDPVVYTPTPSAGDDLIEAIEKVEPRVAFIMKLLATREVENLIVYSSGPSQRVIYKILKDNKWKPRLLSPGRTTCLEKMKNGEIRVLCANGATVASGLNIPFVEAIVLYDQLSYDNMRQAIGRGQRIGRDKQLRVYTFERSSAGDSGGGGSA